MKTLTEIFGTGGALRMQVREKVDGLPYVGAINYHFRADLLGKVCRWFAGAAAFNNLILVGPAGAGKTSLIEQVAARLNWPVYAVSGSGRQKASDWLGGFTLIDGATRWEDGPLAAAMRVGGVFILDEATRLDASEQMALVRILDSKSVTLPNGEVLMPHPLFRFAATGNSNGTGDDTGRYAGEKIASAAFLDRMIKLSVDHPNEDAEATIIKMAVNGISDAVVKALVDVANRARGASLHTVVSTRALIAVGREAMGYVKLGIDKPLHEAWMDIVVNAARSDERSSLEKMFELATGKPD